MASEEAAVYPSSQDYKIKEDLLTKLVHKEWQIVRLSTNQFLFKFNVCMESSHVMFAITNLSRMYGEFISFSNMQKRFQLANSFVVIDDGILATKVEEALNLFITESSHVDIEIHEKEIRLSLAFRISMLDVAFTFHLLELSAETFSYHVLMPLMFATLNLDQENRLLKDPKFIQKKLSKMPSADPDAEARGASCDDDSLNLDYLPYGIKPLRHVVFPITFREMNWAKERREMEQGRRPDPEVSPLVEKTCALEGFYNTQKHARLQFAEVVRRSLIVSIPLSKLKRKYPNEYAGGAVGINYEEGRDEKKEENVVDATAESADAVPDSVENEAQPEAAKNNPDPKETTPKETTPKVPKKIMKF